MKYKPLGHTGLLVSQLCLGTMTFGGGQGAYQHIGNVGRAEADEFVRAGIEAGINFFDTADVYSRGESETILGQSLTNLAVARHEVVVATKGYWMPSPPSRRRISAARPALRWHGCSPNRL